MDSTGRTRTRSDDAGWHSNPLGGLNQEVVPIRTAPTIGLQRTVSPLQQKECPVPGTMPPYPLIALDAQNVPQQLGARDQPSALTPPRLGHRCRLASAGFDKGKLGVSRGRKATGLDGLSAQLAGLPEVRSDVLLGRHEMGG